MDGMYEISVKLSLKSNLRIIPNWTEGLCIVFNNLLVCQFQKNYFLSRWIQIQLKTHVRLQSNKDSLVR